MEFTLKNSMRHENYSFPESVVCYKITKKTIDFEKSYCLVCNGENIPVQFSDDNNLVSFITDLNFNEEKHFELIECENNTENILKFENDKIVLKNDFLNIDIDELSDALFVISGEEAIGICSLDAKVLKKECKVEENGPVFARIRIICRLENDDSYVLSLTLSKVSEYVILDEQICMSEPSKMQIIWQNLRPTYRLTRYRQDAGYEANRMKAEEYTDSEGRIFQKILPYDQSNGFANSEYAAFSDNTRTVGVFVGDMNKWDDGSYAIEGNNYINAIRCYCKYDNKKCDLRFSYPLNSGTRQTAIAVYNAGKEKTTRLFSYIHQLYFYHTRLPLDRFKDWVLDWDSDQNSYPKIFDKANIDPEQKYGFEGIDKGLPTVSELMDLIKSNKLYTYPWMIGPVASRVYSYWVAAFDLLSKEMSAEEFCEIKSILAFCAYYCSDENVMPIKTTLGGHPNFLMDLKCIVGLASALFEEHPMALEWKEHYESCVLLTFKFHIRPEVKAWKSLGGRPTENHGTYAVGCLEHILQASCAIEKVYGDNPILCENSELFANWIVNMVTAPINGRRAMPYTGAHAGGHALNPYYLNYQIRVLGYKMMKYNPVVGEHLLSICPKVPVYGHETVFYNGRDIWDFMLNGEYLENQGIEPELQSSKFTGYGYNLRANINKQDEMFVLLQQIDEGQNYRWGRVSQGGCGTIHYYADGKMYSGCRVEDIGDDNLYDDTVGCNFSVLKGNSYCGVGQNDLHNPLIDFPFVKYARVDAGKYSDSEYRYRSVLMVDNRYIVIYDAVRDARTQGKFSWFNCEDEEMPLIFQLKPGAKPVYKNAPEYTIDDVPRRKPFAQDREVRGVSYNGFGDFLTVVTHKKDLEAINTGFGAIVRSPECTDYIFNANNYGEYRENDISFKGKIGFARTDREGFELAIIDGEYISAGENSIEIMTGNASVALWKSKGGLYGKTEKPVSLKIKTEDFSENMKIYQKGKSLSFGISDGFVTLELGEGEFQITDKLPKPQKIDNIFYIQSPDGVDVGFDKVENSDFYELALVGENGNNSLIRVNEPKADLKGLNGKYLVKIRAVNADAKGEWSDVYPMYATNLNPEKIQGFKLRFINTGYEATWGKQLGVKEYKLYRFNGNDEPQCVYCGTENKFIDNPPSGEYGYFVTCVNGFGESEKSIVRNTNSPSVHFDPMPEIKYVRDTIVNLHGYGGFDYEYNENRKILSYPDEV